MERDLTSPHEPPGEPGGDDALERPPEAIQQPLRGWGTEHGEEAPVRAEDAEHLAHCRCRVGKSLEHPGRGGEVEATGRERQRPDVTLEAARASHHRR